MLITALSAPANSPEWIGRPLSAGAFYILVDKLDGHVWTEQELVSLNGEEYDLESATTLLPQQILYNGHDHSFGQIYRYVILNCIVKYYRYDVMFYAIRNMQYVIRNTQYAIRNTR